MRTHFTRGLSFIELIVVIAILATLMSIAVVSLNGIQRRANIDATLLTIITDLKQQQQKAMSGDTEGRSTHDMYGAYFQTNSYTLFHGSKYSAADTANFVIPIDSSLQFTSITLPQSQIIYASGSGEIVGYVAGSNTFTLKNTVTNEQKTVTLNQYGVITAIN